MVRYVAIDPGKSDSKIAEYIRAKKQIKIFQYPTRISEGDFRDDAIEKRTHIIEYEGKVYKVGSGANEKASLETSKLDITHKIAVISALARIASENEEDTFEVAVGIPAIPWHDVPTREETKQALLPEGKINVKYKENSSSEIVKKTFTITKRYVYPESIGALFMDDSPKITQSSQIGVLDIGSLNVSATMWNGDMELIADASTTSELGSSILIQKLAMELSNKFSRCDERYVAKILCRKPENRFLEPNNGTNEQKEKVKQESKTLIKKVLLDHANNIKQVCNGMRWSLDYMTIIIIGGTGQILAEELKETFGDNIIILDRSVFVNVLGYLRLLCAHNVDVSNELEGDPIPFDNIVKDED